MGDDLVGGGFGTTEPGEPVAVWCGFAGDDTVADNWGWVYGVNGEVGC
jgi:hypothetical protein